MGFADKIKDLKDKAQEAAVERSDQIQGAVQKAKVAADRQTGGRYHDKLEQAGAKADKFVEDLKSQQADPQAKPPEPPAATTPPPAAPAPPPASFRE